VSAAVAGRLHPPWPSPPHESDVDGGGGDGAQRSTTGLCDRWLWPLTLWTWLTDPRLLWRPAVSRNHQLLDRSPVGPLAKAAMVAGACPA